MSRYTVFSGSGTALITPFDDSGHVDLDALGVLIDRQLDGGADALIMTGTTGEAPVLSTDEKKEIWRFTRDRIDHAKKKIPLIAGSGGNDTVAAAHLSHEAELAGADALLVVTPYYNKCSPAGLVEHYRTIAGPVAHRCKRYRRCMARACRHSQHSWHKGCHGRPATHGATCGNVLRRFAGFTGNILRRR